MNKVFTLILVIGISIGLLLGSSINILTNKNYDQSENKKQNEFDKKINKDSQSQDSDKKVVSEKPLKENENEEIYINIIIQNGFTSNKVADILYENELIFNKNDFLTLLRCLDLSSKLRVGEKTIKKGSSMIEIIDIITN